MWEKVRLGEYVDILSGFAFKSNLFTDESTYTALIRIRDIKRGYTETFYKGEYKEEYLIHKGDFLIGMDGEFNIAQWTGKPSLLNQRVCKVSSSKPDKLDNKYLFYVLSTKLKKIEDKASFVTVKHLSVKDINSIEIPLPPLPVQQRIADKLDKADTLRRKDQELLKKYDELAQAIFVDMFGDPVKNEKGWERTTLNQFYDKGVKCGPFGSALKKEEFSDQGVPVWNMDNIQNYEFIDIPYLYVSEEKFDELNQYEVNNGDIIISRAGTVGKMCVVETKHGRSLLSTNLIKLSLRNTDLLPLFFVYLMKFFSKRLGRLKTGGEDGFTHMNTGVLDRLEIYAPSLDLQHLFENKIKLINALKAKINVEQSEVLFQALLHQVFKGD